MARSRASTRSVVFLESLRPSRCKRIASSLVPTEDIAAGVDRAAPQLVRVSVAGGSATRVGSNQTANTDAASDIRSLARGQRPERLTASRLSAARSSGLASGCGPWAIGQEPEDHRRDENRKEIDEAAYGPPGEARCSKLRLTCI